MDLDLRKMSSTALVLIGVWMMISAFLWRHTGAQAINSVLVGLALAGTALMGRREVPGAFAMAGALAVWLFFSLWALPGRTPGLVINTMFFSVLAFGFAGSALARAPRTAS